MQLLDAWKNTRFDQPPHVLEHDLDVLESSPRAKDLGIVGETYEDVEPQEGFDCKRSIHFSLLPQPFNGDVLNAEVYILTLNPGFACSDYDANYRKPRFRQALLDNINQTQPPEVLPFIFLDPNFKSHGGYSYWHARLKNTIKAIANRRGMSCGSVQQLLGSKLATIELVPYHSKTADGLHKLPEMLPSARMAIDFVREYVQPKARSGRAIAIIARSFATWRYAFDPEMLCSEAVASKTNRSGYLSPATNSGEAIIDWFC